MKYRAKVIVKKIENVADPEGKAIFEALFRLGYENVSSVRSGKLFFVDLESGSVDEARKEVEVIARDFLSNPIIERFDFELEVLG